MRRCISASIIFIIWLASLTGAQGSGQSWVAAAGPSGIYVTLGNPVPGISEVAAYLVERRTAGEGPWDTLRRVEGPKNAREFAAGLKASQRAMAPVIPRPIVPVDSLWKEISIEKSVDMLRRWGGVLVVRLALGVTILDSGATSGTSYEYRITQLLKNGAMGETVQSLPVSWPGKPMEVRISFVSRENDVHVIRVTWRLAAAHLPLMWKAMRAQGIATDRSAGPLVIREKATVVLQKEKGDSARVLLIDTGLTPGSLYRYSLATYDYYGNHGSNADTVLAAAFPFFRVSRPQRITVESSDSLHGLLIRWRLDDPKNVHSVKVWRSAMHDSGFSVIATLPSTTAAYADQSVEPMRTYFYRLTITSAIGEESPPTARVFGIFRDLTPPLPLRLRNGSEVNNGVSLAVWRTDPLITVFRVYRCEGYGSKFAPFSGLLPLSDSQAVFIDTGASFRPLVSYGYIVRAENTSHVLGPASDTVYAQPKIAPVQHAPYSLTATVAGGSIRLFWPDARSVNPGLGGYQVFRKAADSSTFTALDTSPLPIKRNWFVDSTAAPGIAYGYAVKCVDLYGNRSSPGPLASARVPVHRPLSPAGMRALALTAVISLFWDEPLDSTVTAYHVYRYERGAAPKLVATVEKGTSRFVDQPPEGTGLVFYYVSSVAKNGLESEPSGEAAVRR